PHHPLVEESVGPNPHGAQVQCDTGVGAKSDLTVWHDGIPRLYRIVPLRGGEGHHPAGQSGAMISMATEPAVVGEAVIFRKDKENGLYTGMIASCGAIIPCPAEKSIKNPKRIPGRAA